MREIFRKVGFFMLGILSLLYIIFSVNFAEMRMQFSFLYFPVFVGEVSLFTFFILSVFVFNFRSIKGWKWGAVFYFVCVIVKALWGYSLWGPLAFRHAALFYYPIFIFFGFIFYKRAFLSKPLKIFITFLIFTLCVTMYFYSYWMLSLWIIAFILMRSFRHRATRYFFYAVLLSVIARSYKAIIVTSRTFIVGNVTAVIFLVITLLLIAKIRVFYKAVIAGAILILLAALVFKYSSVNASGTIFDIKSTINWFRMREVEVKARRPYYVQQDFKDIKLFNPKQLFSVDPAAAEKPQVMAFNKASKLFNRGIKHVWVIGPTTETRGVDGAYVNTIFRLFVWRDMFLDFSRHRPILGFSFGKPFRSESLEILNWATGDWQRDGWIESHNSYLSILYRTGILGIALIGFLIWQFCSMVRSFVLFKSSSGILLCSVLIIWLAAANFLPILELPYNAIPFWAFWGVALGYLKELKDKSRCL